MTADLFTAAAAVCLALGTAQIARRLTLPQAFMLTALPWGLLIADTIERGTPLWAVGVALLALSMVIAWRVVQREPHS